MPSDSPVFFFFNDTATTEIYTLSLHDALPISRDGSRARAPAAPSLHRPARLRCGTARTERYCRAMQRSEEHTSELQSRQYLVCRLLLEKKKNVLYRRAFRNLISTTLRLVDASY